jgi:hypothetical protein
MTSYAAIAIGAFAGSIAGPLLVLALLHWRRR